MAVTSTVIARTDWAALAREVGELSRGKVSSVAAARVTAIEREALAFSGDETCADRGDLLHAVALFHYYATAEPCNALPSARAAVRLAERSGDRFLLRRALGVHGIVAADTSDFGMAIHCDERALRLAIDLGDIEGQCAVLNNLGTALTAAAAYRDAIECYRRVVETAPAAMSRRLAQVVAGARGNTALCHLHLQEPLEGIEVISVALRDIDEPSEDYEVVSRVLMEYTYVRLLLTVGDTAKAEQRAANAMRYSRLWRVPRALIAAQNAVALVEVYRGEYEAGIRRLTSSLSMTNSVKAAYRDTLAALVMASEHANRIDLAISYQKELLDATNRVTLSNVQFHHELHAKELVKAAARPDAGIVSLARDRLDRLVEQKDEYDRALEQLETFERIAVTTAAREDPSGGHPYRVARLASLLAERAGLEVSACRALDLAVRLHDIGNVGIADRIMLSSKGLTERDRSDVEAHTSIGFDLLRKYDGPDLQLAATIARHHHERWDGSGYPDRLAGDRIPLPARMTGLAESYDALTHARGHRAAFDSETALRMVRAEAGSSFDPTLTDAFVDLVRDLAATHADVDEFLESGARASRYVRSRRQIRVLLGDLGASAGRAMDRSAC